MASYPSTCQGQLRNTSILSLILASSAVVFISASYQGRRERIRLQEELERRAAVLAESLRELSQPLIASERTAELQALVDRFGRRQRLSGVGFYAPDGRTLALTDNLPAEFHALPAMAAEAMQLNAERSLLLSAHQKHWHLFALPLHRLPDDLLGALVLFHDATYIRQHAAHVWQENFARLFLHVLAISLITLLIVRWSLIQPMTRTVEWLQRLRTGELTDTLLPKGDFFGPLTRLVP